MTKNNLKEENVAMETTGYQQAGSQTDVSNHHVPQAYGPMYKTGNTEKWNQPEQKSSKFLVGTLMGAVVGAAAALMLAPKTGKEMQSGIKAQTMKLKEKAAQSKDSDAPGMVQQIKDQSATVIDKVKNMKAGQTPMDDGTASTEDAKDQTSKELNKQKEQMQNQQEQNKKTEDQNKNQNQQPQNQAKNQQQNNNNKNQNK